MNTDFTQKYIRHTVEQLLATSLIAQSLDTPTETSLPDSDGSTPKAFSVSDHLCPILANMCRGFAFEGVHGAMAELLGNALTPSSRFFTHFAAFYGKVR
jgi:hypothetical protein